MPTGTAWQEAGQGMQVPNCSEPRGNKLVGAEKEKGTMGIGRKRVGSMGESGVEGSKMESRSRGEHG